MPTPFHTLRLPVSLDFTQQQLEDNYRQQSKLCHPDGGGSTEDFEALTVAKAQLEDPAKRLTAYLQAAHPGTNLDRGAISPEIADLFPIVATLLESTKAALASYDSAQSALQKALLQPRLLELQAKVSSELDHLSQLERQFSSRAADHVPPQELGELARSITFIQKWRAQLQAEYGKLWVG